MIARPFDNPLIELSDSDCRVLSRDLLFQLRQAKFQPSEIRQILMETVRLALPANPFEGDPWRGRP